MAPRMCPCPLPGTFIRRWHQPVKRVDQSRGLGAGRPLSYRVIGCQGMSQDTGDVCCCSVTTGFPLVCPAVEELCASVKIMVMCSWGTIWVWKNVVVFNRELCWSGKGVVMYSWGAVWVSKSLVISWRCMDLEKVWPCAVKELYESTKCVQNIWVSQESCHLRELWV